MTNGLSEKLLEIYRLLYDHFGHRNWWPGETPFEVIIGAILTQNTAWTNVEKAINNLKAADALTIERILSLPADELALLIRPSGYYNQKALRLKAVCQYFSGWTWRQSRPRKELPTSTLRAELLAINGIGPETADSILLYALDRTVFVVDTYTKRALNRLEIIDNRAKYDDIQQLFVNNLEPDRELFNDYHAQFVALGKYYCRTKPLCNECPLKGICSYNQQSRIINHELK
ncbi:endonuclease III domain-containing protein [bacterium]|nr:endonuclease III domain-containing protein [bacterium]